MLSVGQDRHRCPTGTYTEGRKFTKAQNLSRWNQAITRSHGTRVDLVRPGWGSGKELLKGLSCETPKKPTKLSVFWIDLIKTYNNVLLVSALTLLWLTYPPHPSTRPVRFAVLERLVDFITMSSSQLDQSVVSTDWLNKKLKNTKGGLAVLDTTWFSDKDACSDFSK